MLPSCADVVIVEIVVASDMVAHALSVVMVYGTALVLCIDVFKHHMLYRSLVFESQFQTEEPVFEVVHQITALFVDVPFFTLTIAVVVELQHGRVVFEELVGVGTEPPTVIVPVDTCHPAAYRVTCHIGVDTLIGVSTAGFECMPEGLESSLSLIHLHRAVGLAHVGCTSEDGGHLHSQLHREGHEPVFIAYFQVSRLGMV